MNYQQHLANSAAIRSEIQRFESVHPNIYSIYELLERVEEPLLQNQIREHVIAIEEREDIERRVMEEESNKERRQVHEKRSQGEEMNRGDIESNRRKKQGEETRT
ncbi:hypothetical protein JOQ06_007924 [Pogonophryne albipinna]|uniref:Uncharacterized protein n=1 Tax=Pogonophryne albipinna TaxID=1090488 RepID=A0AAD6A9K4_9TELE|nr:hypothetical protein JOQ06_007924 [Pogonophryne albipinna]